MEESTDVEDAPIEKYHAEFYGEECCHGDQRDHPRVLWLLAHVRIGAAGDVCLL